MSGEVQTVETLALLDVLRGDSQMARARVEGMTFDEAEALADAAETLAGFAIARADFLADTRRQQ